MSRVQPHPSAPHEEAAHHAAAGQQPHSSSIPVQSLNQTAEFFLSNYRLGKTLGIGSFGKVSWDHSTRESTADPMGTDSQVPWYLTALRLTLLVVPYMLPSRL